ncbi:class I SAM-dependent methyltransferase [Aeromonas salmonicida]|uniref:class I SAM-dependent methyltransferase n=1 Tax=Aeromonas salmonicida TaxID=645 RepID=UPI00211728AD|nr:class I SAM-dependent methyltransferase [Aeromonas salmonicida]UUI62659.1 class I SAM-dependent methyltransferase [Aeromonas salmonicida]
MSHGDIWNSIFSSQEWGKYPSEDLIRFIARSFYKEKKRSSIKILELGCGPGANIWYLAREGFSFCGVDCSITAIEHACLRLDKEFPNWRQHGELIVGDVHNLPYDSESFDAVIDNECIYCADYETAKDIYNEAWRVTKYNGKLYSRTFASGSWGDGYRSILVIIAGFVQKGH